MQCRKSVVAALVACFALTLLPLMTSAYSDWVGVYARVDKVVLEPNAAAPERIQIWGAFALASKEDRDSYDPAQRGYLYYSLKPGKEVICRKEWSDLKAIAGSDQVVGFGGRRLPAPRVRKGDEKPANPDEYEVNFGLTKMRERGTDYAPIRDVLSVPRGENR